MHNSILIVDDIKVNLKVLEVLLTRNGYDTISALGAKDALALLQIKPVDLIISDILMPEMDGFQFCRLCKLDENLKHIPIVFYSSTHTEAKARKLARQVGAHALIVKPADPAVLLETVKEILNGKFPALHAGDSTCATSPATPMETAETRPSQPFCQPPAPKTDTPSAPYPALLKNIPCTVWTVDTSGTFSFISPAVERITGFTVEEMQDMGKKGWLRRIDPCHAPEVKKAFHHLFQNNVPLDIQYRFERRDGDFIWIHEQSAPPVTRNGKTMVDGVALDISEKKYIQAHRRAAAEDELVRTFASGVAHDLSTLVAGISGYIELACMDETTPRDRDRFLSNALKVSRNASDLTRQLYTLAHTAEPVETRTPLEKTVSQAAKAMMSSGTTAFELKIPPDLWPCTVSAQMVYVFKNLMANAKAALPMDGFMEIIMQNVSLDKPEHTSAGVVPRGTYVKTTIRDNGQGIAPHRLHRIFHPYFTTRSRSITRGKGLGLALCRALVHRHGGVMTATSRQGIGTTMNIFLPAQKPGAGPALSSPGRAEAPPPPKVLVMDANPMMQEITQQILTRAGFSPTCAASAREGVALYQSELNKARPFSAVLISPGGGDTAVAVKHLDQLRRIHPEVKVVVATDDPAAAHLHRHGFSAVVPRPCPPGELVAALTGPSTDERRQTRLP